MIRKSTLEWTGHSTPSWSAAFGLGFLILAGAMYATARAITSTSGFHQDSSTLGFALVIDLAVLLPLAYYLLVVRPLGVPPITTLPVVLAGFLLTAAVLPAGHPARTAMEVLAFPLEVALLGAVMYATYQITRRLRNDVRNGVTFDDSIRRSIRCTFGSSRLTDAIVGELAMLYFALAFWRRRPSVPDGAPSWTSHRASGWGAVFVALAMVLAVEVFVVHVVVMQWSETAARVVTGLGIYGFLWLIADYRALTLRPSYLSDGVLHLRIGTRWAAEIPVGLIGEVRGPRMGESAEAGSTLVVLGRPSVGLDLGEPVELRGLLGIRRLSASIEIGMDDPADFRARLAESRSESEASRVVGTTTSGPIPRPRASASPSGSSYWPGLGETCRWLAGPILENRPIWGILNLGFLAVMVITAGISMLSPSMRDTAVEAIMASAGARGLNDHIAAGGAAVLLAPMIFATNFLAVMVLVVIGSLAVPFIGLVTGLLLAVPLGIGLGLALAEGSIAQLLVVAPVVLLEQLAVVLAMLFAWTSGGWIRTRQRSGGGVIQSRSGLAGPLAQSTAGVGTLLALGATAEAAVVLLTLSTV